MEDFKLVIRRLSELPDNITNDNNLKEKICNHYLSRANNIKHNNGKCQELLVGLTLAQELGITRDDQLIFNEYGKPLMASGQKHFSISHSGDYVVLAIADKPIGIDIERIGRGNLKVAKKVFPQCWLEELALLQEDSDEFNIKFCQYWTLYEACIKQLGCGFSKNISAEDILALSANATVKELEGYVISIVTGP